MLTNLSIYLFTCFIHLCHLTTVFKLYSQTR